MNLTRHLIYDHYEIQELDCKRSAKTCHPVAVEESLLLGPNNGAPHLYILPIAIFPPLPSDKYQPAQKATFV
jgi:hypothetical protein